MMAMAVCVVMVWGCQSVNPEDVLMATQGRLGSIAEARYVVAKKSWEPWCDESWRTWRQDEVLEQDDTTDPYTGCRYVDRRGDDIVMCYDGLCRMRTDAASMTYEMDSLFGGHEEYRVLSVPFYHACRRIIAYALAPSDSAELRMTETDSTWIVSLTIHGERQLEFDMARKDPHVDKQEAAPGDPTSHYEITIDRVSRLPVEYRREMSHECTCDKIVGEPVTSDAKGEPVSCNVLIPDGYSERRADLGDKLAMKADGRQKVTEFRLHDEDGRVVAMVPSDGKVKLLMFTGIGCGACMAAIPTVNKIAQEADSSAMEVLVLECWGREAADVKAYRRKMRMKCAMLTGGRDVMVKYNLGQEVPQFIVVGRDGRIVGQHSGWSDAVGQAIKAELLATIAQ